MGHPFEFTVKGLTFTLDRGHLFLDDREISFRELFLFVRGKIDLTPPEPEPTIVDIVLDASGTEGLDSNADDFDILREALTATDLVGTLADREADFSVFAPTDTAFIQLARDLGADVADGDEAGALAAILAALEDLAGSPEGGLDLLKQVLLYHVAPDGRTLAELRADGTITTAQGGTIDADGIRLADAELDLADPSVVAQDIDAANGTIQVIDRVLLPIDIAGNDPDNVVDVAAENGNFTILIQALTAAGLDETVRGLEDVTIFAPTDAAFVQLAADLGFDGDTEDLDAVFGAIAATLEELSGSREGAIDLLSDILLYHVSPGSKTAAQVDALDAVSTLLEGATFGSDGTELIDNEPDIENPSIVIPDIPADNALIQAIDRVLIPLDIPGNTLGQTIKGSFRRDDLVGTDGDDQIFGLAGRDTLDGGAGDDLLKGGFGRDLLNGGAGDDHLFGGFGRDRFDFREISGDDVVKDLGWGDRVLVSKDDFSTFAALQDATEFDAGDAVITTEDGSITLEAVDAHEFSARLFHFA